MAVLDGLLDGLTMISYGLLLIGPYCFLIASYDGYGEKAVVSCNSIGFADSCWHSPPSV